MSTKVFPSYWPPSNEHEKTFRPYLLRSIVKGSSVPSLLTVSKRQNGVRLLLTTEWLEDLVIFRWYLSPMNTENGFPKVLTKSQRRSNHWSDQQRDSTRRESPLHAVSTNLLQPKPTSIFLFKNRDVYFGKSDQFLHFHSPSLIPQSHY